jgi:hypothetical protein
VGCGCSRRRPGARPSEMVGFSWASRLTECYRCRTCPELRSCGVKENQYKLDASLEKWLDYGRQRFGMGFTKAMMAVRGEDSEGRKGLTSVQLDGRRSCRHAIMFTPSRCRLDGLIADHQFRG